MWKAPGPVNCSARIPSTWSIRVETVLTDNGREYCGRYEDHPYELYLAFLNVFTKATQTDGDDQLKL